MTQDELSEALTIELGADDASALFTTQQRVDALNLAQGEFARETRCLGFATLWPVTTWFYDLDTIFGDRTGHLTPTVLWLRVRDSQGVERDTRLEIRAPLWFDRHVPGWRIRAVPDSPGTPQVWSFFGQSAGSAGGVILIWPPPAAPSTETWSLLVQCAVQPLPMTDGSHEPFRNVITDTAAAAWLRPYHWALAHRAAAELEYLRKDTVAIQRQLAQYQGYTQQVTIAARHRGGRQIVTGYREYFRRGTDPAPMRGAGDPLRT
jgi:hypothetical protein